MSRDYRGTGCNSRPMQANDAQTSNSQNSRSRCLRQLLERNEVMAMLKLNDDELQQLVATRQITPIRIVGKERFDSWDIDGLLDSYKRTAMRTIESD